MRIEHLALNVNNPAELTEWLCDNLDIVQNLFLGRERLRYGLLDEASMEQAARETLASLSVRTVKSVRQKVSSLSGGQRKLLEMARALMVEPEMVICCSFCESKSLAVTLTMPLTSIEKVTSMRGSPRRAGLMPVS